MKRRVLAVVAACTLSLSAPGVFAASADPALSRQVSAFIDAWHDDAAHARMAYFDKIAADGVYIGTDKTELWGKAAFETWAKPYFDKKSAWAFKAVSRNVYTSGDGKIVWFDELLDTQMGPCQASGVLRKTANGFEIEHYQLSMAVPNELGKSVTDLITAHANKAAAK
ncbi:nuclear transport factor 2 family protein [Massilia sp. DWR3-1-1]|uniref:nuclear transport factor 2 family protein n=1 Tax=Massilia sp. DWR3-1-1 TaxID=2804559 RepID=UPI003CEDFA26